MSKLPLSVITAVLNEEKNLPQFLKYASSIAEEIIIVVDYRNSDNSADIAKKHGARVIQDRGESAGIVFNNKNKGAHEAKYDWIMILDADERMDETLIKELNAIVTGKNKIAAVMFQTGFINYEFGKFFEKCDQKNKTFIRLFRKGEFEYKTGETAEGLGIETQGVIARIPILRSLVRNADPRIRTLRGKLIHNSHPTIHDFVRKIDHYSDREARILFKNNRHPNLFALGFKLVLLPHKEFVYKYFVWRMYLEGTHGFIASALYAFYSFLIWSRYFTLVYHQSHKKEIKKILREVGFTPDV